MSASQCNFVFDAPAPTPPYLSTPVVAIDEHKAFKAAAEIRSSVIALGENKGVPRIYLQGAWMLRAGFSPDSRFEMSTSKGKLVLKVDIAGRRKVSGKKERTIPVIDIQSANLADTFAGVDKLLVTAHNQTITITPAHTVVLVQGRRLTLTEGSMFSGGGFLTEAAASLGFKPQFAVEVVPEYAAIFEANHPSARMFNMSVEQVPFETLQEFRPLGLLTMGICCEPFSRGRHWEHGTDEDGKQIRRDRSLPSEAHPNGDMTWWALRAVEATNAHTVLIENVPDYLNSSSYYILRNVLDRLGYFVDAKIIDPTEYGELTTRKRAIIIARTGLPVAWPEPVAPTRTMADILDPVEGAKWFNPETKSWLYNHWANQTAKGNGFASPQITADSPTVGTITKRYFAQQGQHPVVKHPTLPNTHRWLSMAEVKRLHGIREDYFVGGSKTTAGEVIGQGIIVPVMSKLIAANMAA
jgi:DNA (cytosine-5)-methyltransferase 1